MQPLTADISTTTTTALLLDREILKRRALGGVDGLIEDLKDILTNTWSEAVRQSLVATIGTLESGAGPVTVDELDLVERQVANQLGMPLDVAKQRNIVSIERAAYAMGMKEAAKGSGVKIAWGLPDSKSLDVLDRNTRFWIGSHYDDNLQEGFRAVLQDYFEGGYNRRDLAELMRRHFRTLGDKGAAYWDLLADHTVTKTREIGRVAGYERAGIEVVRIKARLDSKTSEICRRLHGTVIAVKDMRRQVDRYLAACGTGDKAKIKGSWPWWSDAKAENLISQKAINRQVARGKIGMPPYHARCFPPGVKVIMQGAEKDISEVVTGELVLTHTATFKPVKDVFISEFSGELVEIEIGGETVACTPDHPIAVYVGGGIVWRSAKDITTESEVVIFRR